MISKDNTWSKYLSYLLKISFDKGMYIKIYLWRLKKQHCIKLNSVFNCKVCNSLSNSINALYCRSNENLTNLRFSNWLQFFFLSYCYGFWSSEFKNAWNILLEFVYIFNACINVVKLFEFLCKLLSFSQYKSDFMIAAGCSIALKFSALFLRAKLFDYFILED